MSILNFTKCFTPSPKPEASLLRHENFSFHNLQSASPSKTLRNAQAVFYSQEAQARKLTAVGEMLYSHVEQACTPEQSRSKNTEMQSLDLGEVKIGVGDTILRYLLIPFLQKFIRDYPNIKLKLSTAHHWA